MHLATLRLGCCNSVHKHLDSHRVVKGSHESARKKRVSDGNGAVSFNELRDEIIVNFFMDVQAPQSCASLPCGPHLQSII